jgi:arylsulfatase
MRGPKDSGDRKATRRDFLAAASGALIAHSVVGKAFAEGVGPAILRSGATGAARPNLLFIFSDQERYRRRLVPGLDMPAHERLQKTGTTFHSHYTGAVMCTSSRSVMLTGLQTPDTGMFENTDLPWVPDLSTDIPTIGHMLRKAGYYTAYKGKWHLNGKFDAKEPDSLLTKRMEEYGFADFYSPGDIVGHQLGGYEFDHLIAGSATTWLRRHATALAEQGKPWCLFVSLVNPHDIMYFNTDEPGGKGVQDNGHLVYRATKAPNTEFYRKTWGDELPANLRQPIDEPGRPQAHLEFHNMWNYVLGQIPTEEARWQRFSDFYINSQRAVDEQLMNILTELDRLNVTDRTAVVYTADHGEMAGAHGLRGKGPFAYEEGMHIPFYVVHPDVKGGQNSSSLTAHIDIVPTLLALAGVDASKRAEFANRELPGKDLSPIISDPSKSELHSARESILFTYSGLVTNDSDLFRIVADAKAKGVKPGMALVKAGFTPSLKKRGSLRTAFDGRYKFSRYFSPLERNSPKSLDELYRSNDVELFDLAQDPSEMKNLAVDREVNGEVISAMNEKLEKVIKAEIGKDDGREMPNVPLIDWTIGRPS